MTGLKNGKGNLVKFSALNTKSTHLPSLPLLVGHIRVLSAIVTVNTVHGRPVGIHWNNHYGFCLSRPLIKNFLGLHY